MTSSNIKINKYIGEKQIDFNNIILSKENSLIVAPTGSGKSYSVNTFIKQNPKLKVAFLLPTVALVNNMKGSKSQGIPVGSGFEFLKKNKHRNSIITTYDSLKKRNDFDVIIVDEAHEIAGSSSYREAILPILQFKKQIVFITATPEVIEGIKGFKKYDFSFNKKRKSKRVKIIQTKQSSLNSALEIINNPDRDKTKLTWIRLNNKKSLDELFEHSKKNNKVLMYYSDSAEHIALNQKKEDVLSIKRGVVPKEYELLLTTCILDSGVDLTVLKDVQCYAIEDNKMPHPVSMVQLAARVRSVNNYSDTQYNLELTLIGKYGDTENCDDYILPSSASYLYKCINDFYEIQCDFDMFTYTGLLSYYGLNCEEVAKVDLGYDLSSCLSKLSDIQIANNIQAFPIHYDNLALDLSEKGVVEELELITGNKRIGHYKLVHKSDKIINNLKDAISCNISFYLFIGNTYRKSKVENLINAYNEFRSSNSFAIVIDELLECKCHHSFKMNLANYNRLNLSQSKMIREVKDLIFKGEIKKNRKSVNLTRKENCKHVNRYIDNLRNL